jgi:serine/threonine-protein kinase HipA
MKLAVFAGALHVGTLEHDRDLAHWRFEYAPQWQAYEKSYPLCPALPLKTDPAQSKEEHSRDVRIFFENLLPEGQALDDAAAANKISKSETFGLLTALGRETAGALEILIDSAIRDQTKPVLRVISPEQLSQRIRARPHEPFTVWDGRVRLSIAGYQDKLAVYEDSAGAWYLVEGSTIASTHLLKPEPVRNALAGMTTNEHLCMRLAARLNLPVARTRLAQVPEPILLVERFDRRRNDDGVSRLHLIDGCQALSLPVGFKYERPYGRGETVKNIRDGANLPDLFNLLSVHSPTPAADRLKLLRWTIFQVLIGNIDAHGKNLSFFVTAAGLELAPAYDLVSGLIYSDLEDDLAMAIGDEFSPRQISAIDWAQFAKSCKLPRRLVATELRELSNAARTALPVEIDQLRNEGGHADTLQRVTDVIRSQAELLESLAPKVTDVADKFL